MTTVFITPVQTVHIMPHCMRLLQRLPTEESGGIRLITDRYRLISAADFSGELIKRRKVYPSRFKSCLPDLQFVRNQADYSSESVSRQRAYKRLSLSEEFIGFIEKEILK